MGRVEELVFGDSRQAVKLTDCRVHEASLQIHVVLVVSAVSRLDRFRGMWSAARGRQSAVDVALCRNGM